MSRVKKKRAKKYRVSKVGEKPPTNPPCGCGKPTELTRTSPGGIYFKCEAGHELFVTLGDLPEVMRRRWAKDGSDVPEARRVGYYKGRDVAARALSISLADIKRLHVPLAELGE